MDTINTQSVESSFPLATTRSSLGFAYANTAGEIISANHGFYKLQGIPSSKPSIQISGHIAQVSTSSIADFETVLSNLNRYDDTINAQSTVALLQQIEQQHPAAARIYVICDNARYYHSRIVNEYLADSKIELIFLPPYAPNPNLIERYWRFFKKEILNGKYDETFAVFKRTCDDFFVAFERYKDAPRSLLIDNFQIIDRIRVPKFEVR